TLTRHGVAEDHRAQGCAIERALGIQHAVAERLGDPAQPDGAGRDSLTCQHVVIDDDGAQLTEAARSNGLAGGDAAGETDPDHDLETTASDALAQRPDRAATCQR